MGIHKNAPLTPAGRETLVRRVLDEGQTPMAVATAMGVCVSTVRKWVYRFRAEGAAGLQDRSSRPHRSPARTPAPLAEQIAVLRRQRRTGGEIATAMGLSRATVFRILARLGMNRLKSLEPAEPVRRYERATPGEMLHIDIKKLGRFNQTGHRITGDRQKKSRGVGWDFVHVCIDDASRVAFSRILPDEKKESAVAFLEAALAYYASLGITVQRVMTDNGGCYRSHAFRQACKDHGIKHIRTRPYTPKTNGKAERFIQTALREWAYAQAYETSDQRADELPRWLHRYNWHRPHGSLKAQTPISRLGLAEDNLMVAAIRLLLLTGARVNEVLKARWEWVDIERRVINLPDSKTGRKTLFLSEPAIEVLKSLKTLTTSEDSPFVLRGRTKDQPLSCLKKPWERICTRAKLVDVRLHDLRHTAATVGVTQGMNLPVIGRLLGHSQASTTQRYAHVDIDPALHAVDKIGSAITNAMGF